MAIHMFSICIQEHVTIDKLALTDLFSLATLQQTLQLHYNGSFNCWIMTEWKQSYGASFAFSVFEMYAEPK